MYTEKRKVKIILQDGEREILSAAKDILIEYLGNTELDEILTLNQELQNWHGKENSLQCVQDTLIFLLNESQDIE